MTGQPPRRSAYQLFLWFWLPVLAYIAVIFTLSAQPNLQPPLHFDKADKFFHMLEYGGLGFLMARALRATARIRDALLVSLIVLAVGAVIATSDEAFQRLIPGRDSNLFDGLADFTGLLFAQLIYLFFTHE